MYITTNKIVICLLLTLAFGCIYVIASSLYSKPASFKDVKTFQQYWLDPYANNPYFAKDIYIVPGQARLSHNINTKNYDNSYLPYESAVPAIDVLRANQNNKNNEKNLQPSYYSQVIRHNTMP